MSFISRSDNPLSPGINIHREGNLFLGSMGNNGGDPFFNQVTGLWHFDGDTVDYSIHNFPFQIADATLVVGHSVFPATPNGGALFFPQGPITFNAGGALGAYQLSPAQGAYTVEFATVITMTSPTYLFRDQNNEFIFNLNWFGGNGARVLATTRNGFGLSINSPLLPIADNGYHRIALVRYAGAVGVTNLYVDGVLQGTANDPVVMNIQNGVQWGTAPAPQPIYQDETRITSGIARYSGPSYPLATAPFPNYLA